MGKRVEVVKTGRVTRERDVKVAGKSEGTAGKRAKGKAPWSPPRHSESPQTSANEVHEKNIGVIKKTFDTATSGELQLGIESVDAANNPATNSALAADSNTPAPTVTGNNIPAQPVTAPKGAGVTKMEFTKDSKERKGTGKAAVYHAEGLRGSVKISSTMFPGGEAPETLDISGDFVQAGASSAKLTKEERAAKRAAQPKLTQAERLVKLKERAARLEAKLQSSGDQASM